MTHHPRQPIAVVGVSALFPGSVDNTGFWTDILAGTDRITDVPPSHWLIDDHYDSDQAAPDKTYGRRGGFLGPVDLDVMGFGIPPTMVPSTDTAQLLALIVAQRVLDDAIAGQFSELDRSRASVILGVTSGQELFGAMASRMSRPMWLQGMRRAGVPEDVALAACEQIADLHPEWTESTFPGLLGNVVAGRIANRMDLGGTNCVTDAACASSFSALSMGVNELYLGDSDLVIAGGVDTMNDIFMYMCFSKTPALSSSEDIRPFSDSADGTMLGEGIGMVAIKRLSDAERDGNRIYCVINGIGASSDGRSKSVYAPVSSGQARALDNAYAKTGYTPDTVELIEAHGTGTVAGDAAEFGGLEIAFKNSGRADRQWCALGSVKSQIGHTKAAAGAAGLIKVILGLHNKVLPPTAKVDAPNPLLDLENSPFYLNTSPRPWVRGSDHERRGSVSSFGFGGSNFHVALSEYTGPGVTAPRLRTADAELVVLCGDDGAGVTAQAQVHLAAATVAGYLPYLAQTSQRSYRADAAARLSLVAATEEDLQTRLAQAIDRIQNNPAESFSTPDGIHYGVGHPTGEVALLFPGQGSQYLGMGSELARYHTAALKPWDLAADLNWGETSLQEVVFPRTSFAPNAKQLQEATLTSTEWAQPAIGAASLGILSLLRQIGISPAHTGGHSFGEITALHAAGVLSQVDMLRVARRRGELMAEAAQTAGAMTAVALPIEKVREILDSSGIEVVVANHNSQSQVVLSGPTDAIERVEAHFKTNGTTAKRLPVATAFHSPVVSGASEAFTNFLDSVEFNEPGLPVYANETAAPYPHQPEEMRSQLGRQLANPVRFVEMIEGMHHAGARVFVEVGPSSILTGLVKKILRGRDHRAITLDSKKKPGVRAFLSGLGQLVAAGVPMDLGSLWTEYAAAQNPHELASPKLTIAINGANHDKPYPPADLSELAGPNQPSANELPPTHQSERIPTPLMSSPTPSTPPVSSNGHTASADNGHLPPKNPGVPPAPTLAPATGVLEAYAAIQNQTAQAHADYVKAMAQVHSTFLAAAQQSVTVLGQLAGGVTTHVAPSRPSVPAPTPATIVVPAPAPVQPAAPDFVTPIPAATIPQPVPVERLPEPVPVAAAPALVIAAPVAAPVETTAGNDDLTMVLLGVVSEKTGYPTEMLSMEMGLESDLGIDSIKRVEILSGMEEAVPGLPEVDLQVMADLVTLGEIVNYMASQVTPTEATPPVAAPVETTAGNDDLTMVLLGVVSEKTGYPTEMLSMEMGLESDLGIDSIKRVEILSGMEEAVPGLPEVDLQVMADLVTLGEIVNYMASQVTTPSGGSSSAANFKTPAGPTLSRFVLQTVLAPPSGERMAGLSSGRIAVTSDGGDVAPRLVTALRSAGIYAEHTDEVVAAHTGVIFLGGLRPVADVNDAIALNRQGFAAARAMARNSEARLFVAVSGLGGKFGTDGASGAATWSAGLIALARTAAVEWPETSVKAIDMQPEGDDAERIASAIANELLTGGPEREVGLTNGQRFSLRSAPIEVQPGQMPLGPDDVIVVSGGARGVTAATMIELALESGAKFVLLGRSALQVEPANCASATGDTELKKVLLAEAKTSGTMPTPAELSRQVSSVLANREIRSTIAAIDSAGGRACYEAIDVTDTVTLAELFTKIRATVGPITGVVHGAGVLADRLIEDKTDDQFDLVFNTKVQGLRALLAATESDQLKLLLLFSSVAARTGNRGQVDYAMANEVLNKVAVSEAFRRGPTCGVKALGWGPWDGGMVTPSLRSHFESMGVSLIPLHEGARMLVDEVRSPQTDQIELVLGGGVLQSVSPAPVS